MSTLLSVDMELETSTIRSVCRAAGLTVVIVWLFGALTSSLADTRHYQLSRSSSMISGSTVNYTSDGVAFAQMDEDGREEFVTVERTAGFPSQTVATISTWRNGMREIEWQSERLSGVRSIVVGNVDDDPMKELVLFGERNYAGKDTLNVIQWDGSSYRTTGSDHLSARLGALGDVDADGREEFVLVQVPDPVAEAEGTEPAMLQVAKYRGDAFERTLNRDLGLGVMAIAVGDLDGDGRAEIATCEESARGVRGQIAIYTVDPDLGIRRLFARNGFSKEFVSYLGIFASEGTHYLLVIQGRQAWKSVFRLANSPDGVELVPVNADRVRVFAEGLRSTMAYSAERRAFVRFLDRKAIEFIPE